MAVGRIVLVCGLLDSVLPVSYLAVFCSHVFKTLLTNHVYII